MSSPNSPQDPGPAAPTAAPRAEQSEPRGAAAAPHAVPAGPAFAPPGQERFGTPGPPTGLPGFAAPHVAPPVGTLRGPADPPRRGRPLGTIALVMSIVAGVLASAVAGFAAFRIGRGAGGEIAASPAGTLDWRVLSPVRDIVLVAEVAFWSGTVLGIAAFVLGIVAIARRRGRGAGIAAVVISVLGPIVFAVLVAVALFAGAATTGVGDIA